MASLFQKFHVQTDKNQNIHFVTKVLNYSSEYGIRLKSYTVENIVGDPQSYPKYGDFVTSLVLRTYGPWWTKAPMTNKPIGQPVDGFTSQDFIEVLFETQLYPTEVLIYETFNPGCVVRIYACNRNLQGNFKTGEIKWALLWQGAATSKTTEKTSRCFSPPLNKIDFPTNLLRIEFDCTEADYYTELDGIGLIGNEASGKQNLKDRSVGFKIENTAKLLEKVSSESAKDEKHLKFSATKEDREYFSILPNETILKILNYLNVRDLCSIACTSRRLLYIAYDPINYRELDLQPFWISLDDIGIQAIQLRAQCLQKVSLSWTGAGGQITAEVFHDFITKCGETIEVLRLGCCRFINDESIERISKTCQSLLELDLQACIHLKPDAFTPIKLLTKLKNLNLYRCQITDDILVDILKTCVDMEYLNLGATQSLTMDTIADQLAVSCPSLKALDLWRSNISGGGLSLLSGCTELIDIDLGWTPALRNISTLDMFVKSCKKLKKLFLTTCRDSNPELINSIATSLPDLEQLDLLGSSSLTIECIENVFKRCPKLCLVDLSFCSHFSENVVAELRKSYTHITIQRSFQD